MNRLLGAMAYGVPFWAIIGGFFWVVERVKSPLWWLAHIKVTRLRKERHTLLMQRRAARNYARAMRQSATGITITTQRQPEVPCST